MTTNGTYPTTTTFSDALRRRAEDLRVDYGRLQQEQKRIAVQIERLKAYIMHLNGLLDAEGIEPIRLGEPKATTGFARPGNRSKDMPMRKPQWDNVTLTDAIDSILSERSDALHADMLVALIYDISTPAEKRRAKHSLVSTLRQGVKAGRWEGLPKNRFRGSSARQAALVSR